MPCVKILPDIDEFLAELHRQEASPATVRNDEADLRVFARWFADSTGGVFAAKAVRPTELRDYKAYLRTVEQRTLVYNGVFFLSAVVGLAALALLIADLLKTSRRR